MYQAANRETVTLSRETGVVEVPSGRSVKLYPGTELILMQSLGGSFTVMTHLGEMFSIAGRDADALGKEVPPQPSLTREDGMPKTAEDQVWDQLRTCYDPEIPHNVVDLGLIYECRLLPVEDGHRVEIRMTLTAPGCGMGEWIKKDIEGKLMGIPGIRECRVEIVFDPPWDRSRMHPALRRELA